MRNKEDVGANDKDSKLFNTTNCKRLIIHETKNSFEVLMNNALVESKHLMDQCNQRIHMERERSRERLKLKS
jgi:hypothetical protein